MVRRGFQFSDFQAPVFWGVLNVTPDSFSDGGAHLEIGAAVAHAKEMVAAGARVIDVGAEASSFFRAGVVETPAEEQLRRLLPVLRELVKLEAVISVDTRSAAVAAAALETGAHIINDISAGMHDAEMLGVVARGGAAMVLMHMGAVYPKTPAADDADVVHTVRNYLERRIQATEAAGIERSRIAVDPGVGFGKTIADNWRLALRAREVGEMRGSRVPVMLGISRKRFLETPPAVEIGENWAELVESFRRNGDHPRDAATAALTRIAIGKGVEFHRVHNVGLVRKRLRVG